MGDDSKTELAEERTEYAEDRTVLANERTFAGWLRTGLGAVAVGLAFQALFEKMDPQWVPKAIATAFLTIAILILWLAQRTACRVLTRLHTHEIKSVGGANLRLIAYLLIAATAALIAALWLVRVG
jgi:putative membrane protein